MKVSRASIFTKLVILILVVYAAITLITLRESIKTAEQENKAYLEQRDNLRRANEMYQHEIDHSEDDETKAEIARDKLGLVLPGERIFRDISN